MLVSTATQDQVLLKGMFRWEQEVRFRHSKAVLAFRGVPAEEAFTRLLFCSVDFVLLRHVWVITGES